MSINLLDISHYQENPLYNQYIDWPKLKADPLNFRGIWIKLSEGELRPTDSGAYSIEDATRQVNGAKSVDFEAINGYHFYYYHVPMANGTYYILDAQRQAQAFYEAYKAVDLKVVHPMTDCEDPFISKFLLWNDTPTANAAIAFARKLNLHLENYHRYVTNLFGVKPDIYSGKWWTDKFVPLLINNGYSCEVQWLKEYNFVLADYDGTLNIPNYIDTTKLIAWQRTSSPVPPVQGIPVGRVVPGDALDVDLWMQTEEAFLSWAGNQPTTTDPLEPRVAELENRADLVDEKVNKILEWINTGVK